MAFPNTKYMGSKQAILSFIKDTLSDIEFDTALDAFSGSGCVGYAIKEMGKKVITNDHMKFSYHIAKATIENNSIKLSQQDISRLLKKNRKAKHFIRNTFKGLYFSDKDNAFIDNTFANIKDLRDIKKSLAIASLCRACMKKRPRGIFTFTGNKGFDGRKDLKLSMEEQFLDAIALFNNAVFSNGLRNKAYCLDVFDIPNKELDLVYIDTPYVSPHSDCDYTRRYHFVEGLCSYWRDTEIQEHTTTKKFKSYPTDFKAVKTVENAFKKLFDYFRNSKIVVSYGSNGMPNKKRMFEILKEYKKNVYVEEISHTYYFGNHGHKKGNKNNSVKEYLFVGV